LKKILFTIAVIALLPVCCTVNAVAQPAGSTYYYKQVLHVHNAQKSKGDNSHLFVTFTNKGCYDSDRGGYTINNGFLDYEGTGNGRHAYYGSSFWGMANYYFAGDYSRLNVKVEADGEIYVYEKSTPSAGVLTSSKIKSKTAPVPMPVYPVYPVPPGPDPSPGPAPRPRPKPDEYGYVSCTQCYGSGNCSNCKGTGLLDGHYTGKADYSTCPSCTRGRCRSCNGNGKVYRRIR
jgi:hypothetical protein